MNPSEVLEKALIDGLTLSISTDEKIRIIGDQKIIDEWLPLIREHKNGIIVLLQREMRQKQVWEMLATDPDEKYAVLVDDATTDPVRVMVGIRGIAVFELHIPHAHYDGLALLQVVEQYSTDTALNLDGSGCPLPQLKERSLAHPDVLQRKAA